jgi:CrcB protein
VGTLAVNVIGCVVVGALARWFLNNETHPHLQPALIVGFCGGFTTFSAFSLETVGLLTGGATVKALAYVAASVVLSLIGTSVGFFLGRGT